MTIRAPYQLALAAALALTAGAATLPSRIAAAPDTPAAATTPQACFWAHNVDGFAAPDDRTVNLRVGMRDYYELKLFAPCLDIDWDHRIALRSRGGEWICEGAGLDTEIDTRSIVGHQRCQVTSVHKLTPAEVAGLGKNAKP
jgi:Family of unknown function (DUF6491)